MKKRISVFGIFCVVFFFIFAAFMAWYLPSMSSVRSKTAETRQNLETSEGRERKQQAEYDKAVEELPLVQADLEEKNPLADAAEQTVSDLKARRKELRSEKEKLEKEAGSPDGNTENGEVPSDGE